MKVNTMSSKTEQTMGYSEEMALFERPVIDGGVDKVR